MQGAQRETAADAYTTQYVDTRHLAGRDKAAALREFYGRELMRVDLRPHDNALDGDFAFRAAATALGQGVAYARCTSTPAHFWRSPEMVRDGSNDVYLTTLGADALVRHRGGDLALSANCMLVLSKARAHEIVTPWGSASACIQVPHASIKRLAPGLEEAPLRVLPPGTPGAALALGYAGLLAGGGPLPSRMREQALGHLLSLVAAAIAPGCSRENGSRHAARNASCLALIRHDILARLDDPHLDLPGMARAHGVTPRQVQRLFAREGTCFSDVVRQARLERARALLTDPRQRHRRVLQIALDSGFDDVTTFGRAFRRQFGLTPSEARDLA